MKTKLLLAFCLILFQFASADPAQNKANGVKAVLHSKTKALARQKLDSDGTAGDEECSMEQLAGGSGSDTAYPDPLDYAKEIDNAQETDNAREIDNAQETDIVEETDNAEETAYDTDYTSKNAKNSYERCVAGCKKPKHELKHEREDCQQRRPFKRNDWITPKDFLPLSILLLEKAKAQSVKELNLSPGALSDGLFRCFFFGTTRRIMRLTGDSITYLDKLQELVTNQVFESNLPYSSKYLVMSKRLKNTDKKSKRSGFKLSKPIRLPPIPGGGKRKLVINKSRTKRNIEFRRNHCSWKYLCINTTDIDTCKLKKVCSNNTITSPLRSLRHATKRYLKKTIADILHERRVANNKLESIQETLEEYFSSLIKTQLNRPHSKESLKQINENGNHDRRCDKFYGKKG